MIDFLIELIIEILVTCFISLLLYLLMNPILNYMGMKELQFFHYFAIKIAWDIISIKFNYNKR